MRGSPLSSQAVQGLARPPDLQPMPPLASQPSGSGRLSRRQKTPAFAYVTMTRDPGSTPAPALCPLPGCHGRSAARPLPHPAWFPCEGKRRGLISQASRSASLIKTKATRQPWGQRLGEAAGLTAASPSWQAPGGMSPSTSFCITALTFLPHLYDRQRPIHAPTDPYKIKQRGRVIPNKTGTLP